MRGFIIASILFSIMTTGILINYWHTSLFHQEIIKLIEDLSEEPSKENAKAIKITANKQLGSQCVLIILAKSCPKIADKAIPTSKYINTMEHP